MAKTCLRNTNEETCLFQCAHGLIFKMNLGFQQVSGITVYFCIFGREVTWWGGIQFPSLSFNDAFKWKYGLECTECSRLLWDWCAYCESLSQMRGASWDDYDDSYSRWLWWQILFWFQDDSKLCPTSFYGFPLHTSCWIQAYVEPEITAHCSFQGVSCRCRRANICRRIVITPFWHNQGT